MTVATSPASIDRRRASRTSRFWKVAGNHFRLKPAIGQLCTFEELKA